MSEKAKKNNRTQRYTEGMLEAVDTLAELVRTHGMAVLPPRAAEVIGARQPTRANLIEAAVHVMLSEIREAEHARDLLHEAFDREKASVQLYQQSYQRNGEAVLDWPKDASPDVSENC